jgi:vancomycin resistance protein VanW
MKQLIPSSIKLMVKLALKKWKDFYAGNDKKLAQQLNKETLFAYSLSLHQALPKTGATLAKRHNIELAINKINRLVILPGQIFSFWHLVKKPSEKNGFTASRSIIQQSISDSIGGGLCQLSGMIYYMAVQAGLTIIERHAHSMDIYTEAERFTPLGTDATVAYGYKDLRFLNPYSFPLCIEFFNNNDTVEIKLHSQELINPFKMEFEMEKHSNHTLVRCFQCREGIRNLISQDSYILYHPLPI